MQCVQSLRMCDSRTALRLPSPGSISGLRICARATVWQRLARVGRLSGLIASAHFVTALGGPAVHNVNIATERAGMIRLAGTFAVQGPEMFEDMNTSPNQPLEA